MKVLVELNPSKKAKINTSLGYLSYNNTHSIHTTFLGKTKKTNKN